MLAFESNEQEECPWQRFFSPLREHATTSEAIVDKGAIVVAWSSCVQNLVLLSWLEISKTYLVKLSWVLELRCSSDPKVKNVVPLELVR